MGQRWSAAAAVAIVAAAGCATGCGGGSDAPEPLSNTQFRDQTAAICTRFAADVAKVRYPAEPAGFRRWAVEIGGLQRQALDELADVIPPDRVRSTFDDFQSALAALRDSTITAADKVATRADDMRAALAASTAEQRRTQPLARELGLTGCVL